MNPASRGARRLKWSVHREKLGGCLSSTRAGQRSPRSYIATCRICNEPTMLNAQGHTNTFALRTHLKVEILVSFGCRIGY
eukprot:3114887-Prymnesium_polylepis.1